MKTRFLTIVFVLIAVSFFIIQSCDKNDKNLTPEAAKNIALANTKAETSFGKIYNLTKDAILLAKDSVEGKKGLRQLNDICATITIVPFDLTTFPKTITVDYGETGCTEVDGILIKGVINITTTGWFRDTGTVITVNLTNFSLNSYKIEGTNTITNNGRNSDNKLTYSFVVTNGNIINSEDTITWTCNRTIEWFAGEETTLTAMDDEFKITGTQEGVTAEGNNYTLVHSTPLYIKIGCQWKLVEGVVVITSEDEDITLDYGDGTCDSKFIVTYKGLSYVVNIPNAI